MAETLVEETSQAYKEDEDVIAKKGDEPESIAQPEKRGEDAQINDLGEDGNLQSEEFAQEQNEIDEHNKPKTVASPPKNKKDKKSKAKKEKDAKKSKPLKKENDSKKIMEKAKKQNEVLEVDYEESEEDFSAEEVSEKKSKKEKTKKHTEIITKKAVKSKNKGPQAAVISKKQTPVPTKELSKVIKRKKTLASSYLDDEAEEEDEMGEEMFEEEEDGKKKKKKPTKKTKSQETKEKKKHRYHVEDSEEEEEDDMSSLSSDKSFLSDIIYEDDDEELISKHIEKHKKMGRKKDFFHDRDSSSESSDVPSYILNADESFEPEPDFFEIIGAIPDINDISYTSSEIKVTKEEEIKADAVQQDEAKQQTDDLNTDIPFENDEAEIEPESEFSGEESDYSTTSDSLDLWELDNLPRYSEEKVLAGVGGKDEEQDALKELFEIEEEKPITEEIMDTEEMARIEYEAAIMNATKNFLYELIDKIVDVCIEQEENTFLLKNLNKIRIMKAFIQRYESLEQEKVVCRFVDRKVVEYFKKKKLYQHLYTDIPVMSDVITRKYEEACAKLDEALIRRKATIDLKDNVIAKLLEEKNEAENDDIEKIQQFERLVRKSMIRDNSSKINEIVETKLTKMAETRNEISKMRLVIIRQQHLMDFYKTKFTEINDLGNGLLMSEYEFLRIKTESLGKKLEERNKELKKSIIRYQTDMHAVAHIKGKEKIMKLLIQELNEIFQKYNTEKSELRRELHMQKIKREIIRKEIVSINSRGGLLPKPMLMSDFDATQDKIVETQQRIAKLKKMAAEYEEKLENGIFA